MKKPKYIEALLKTIFFWLAVAFACVAILSYMGILQPKPSSYIQDPILAGSFFLVIGFVFGVASLIFRVIAEKKNKRYSELLKNGARIKGVVEKIYLQKSIQYNNQSPYRIQYTYIYQDREYHNKSALIWKKPDLAIGDTVIVYADDLGRSTITD